MPPELHPTLARAVDLRAADAWLHEGTMPAGLDSDGKSLGGQQGPAFLARWSPNAACSGVRPRAVMHDEDEL